MVGSSISIVLHPPARRVPRKRGPRHPNPNASVDCRLPPALDGAHEPAAYVPSRARHRLTALPVLPVEGLVEDELGRAAVRCGSRSASASCGPRRRGRTVDLTSSSFRRKPESRFDRGFPWIPPFAGMRLSRLGPWVIRANSTVRLTPLRWWTHLPQPNPPRARGRGRAADPIHATAARGIAAVRAQQ